MIIISLIYLYTGSLNWTNRIHSTVPTIYQRWRQRIWKVVRKLTPWHTHLTCWYIIRCIHTYEMMMVLFSACRYMSCRSESSGTLQAQQIICIPRLLSYHIYQLSPASVLSTPTRFGWLGINWFNLHYSLD